VTVVANPIGAAVRVSGNDLTGQTSAVSSLCTYTSASNGWFEIDAYVTVTVATIASVGIQVAYTDEASNSHTMTMPLFLDAGTLIGALATVTQARGITIVHAKANTPITVSTSGTFTTVTYNAGAIIKAFV
jgi:hypothetical protein